MGRGEGQPRDPEDSLTTGGRQGSDVSTTAQRARSCRQNPDGGDLGTESEEAAATAPVFQEAQLQEERDGARGDSGGRVGCSVTFCVLG